HPAVLPDLPSESAGQRRRGNPVGNMPAPQIIHDRRQPHQNCDPHLSRHLVSRKVADRSGASSTLWLAAIPALGGTAVCTFFGRFTTGVPNIRGAKNPACNQNSA